LKVTEVVGLWKSEKQWSVSSAQQTQIDNITVSNFVYPAWFETFRTGGSTQFDRQNRIQKRLHLLAGGHIGVFSGISCWN